MPAPQKETLDKGEKPVNTKIFREFKGVYTKSSRVAIPQDNFYDLTNLIPIGASNLHSIPGLSSLLVNFSSDTIYWMQYANLNNTDYIMCFGSSGKVYAYNIGSNSSSVINNSTLLSGAGSRMDQWQSSALLFADSTGYYSWDGTNFVGPITGGTALPTITSATGTGSVGTIQFASSPSTIYSNAVISLTGFTPSGWNGKFKVTIPTLPTVSTATVAGNTGTITFSSAHGLQTGAIVTLTGFNPSGWNGTYVATYSSATAITIPFVAPPATATTVGPVTVGNVVTISTTAATATVIGTGTSPGLLPQNTGSPFAQYLTNPDIAVFSNRVWIYSNRALYVSAINSYTDFTLIDGSIVQLLTDPQLRGQVTKLRSSNGYLYIMGKSSVYVISDVYIPSNAVPPAPVFSILPVQGVIGCDQPASIFDFNRDLMYANTYGFWRLTGVTAEKISEDIDGTIQYNNPGFSISGGACQVNNLLNACFLMQQLNDPIFGTRTIVANYFDQKWWFANYGALTFIVPAFNGNIPSMYGLIGNSLYQLYANYGTSPFTSWQTALWPMEDSLSDKEVLRAGFEMTVQDITGISVTIDTPNTSTQFFPPAWNQTAAVGVVEWINSSNAIVAWQNNSSATVNWFTGSYLLYAADGLGAYAKYVGMTGSTTAGTVYELNSNMMDYILRKRW